MADGQVIIPPDSTGKSIDTSELTRSDGVSVVERQRIVVGSPTEPGQFVDVTTAGELRVAVALGEVIGQLKRIALLLEIQIGQTVSLDDV